MHPSAPAIRSYFEHQLAELLRSTSAERFRRAGSVVFVVQGAGAWEVRLGPSPEVREAVDLTADAIVWLTPESFLELVAGEVPEKGIAIDGDRSLVGALGRAMMPAARGLVALRAAAV